MRAQSQPERVTDMKAELTDQQLEKLQEHAVRILLAKTGIGAEGGLSIADEPEPVINPETGNIIFMVFTDEELDEDIAEEAALMEGITLVVNERELEPYSPSDLENAVLHILALMGECLTNLGYKASYDGDHRDGALVVECGDHTLRISSDDFQSIDWFEEDEEDEEDGD